MDLEEKRRLKIERRLEKARIAELEKIEKKRKREEKKIEKLKEWKAKKEEREKRRKERLEFRKKPPKREYKKKLDVYENTDIHQCFSEVIKELYDEKKCTDEEFEWRTQNLDKAIYESLGNIKNTLSIKGSSDSYKRFEGFCQYIFNADSSLGLKNNNIKLHFIKDKDENKKIKNKK